ncbi:MAG: hypothetical protein K2K16_12830 [Ruminococcus sp.]|nr:hypothetical protein [Ruminococcus sp.]
MKNTVKSYIDRQINKANVWGGSCYGMSNVVSLIKAGYLTPSKWTKNSETAHDLKYPNKSDDVENLINFYHLSQYLPDIQDVYNTFSKSENQDKERDNLRKIVTDASKVKNGGLPV